ncbi:MAG: hypothetical protein ACKN9C_05270 [Fluviibacter sp.]
MSLMQSKSSHLPQELRWFLTVYVAVLVPIYVKTYGPTNFLYFCDMALLTTLVAMWLRSAVLISAAAVGILLPQLLWALDFMSSLFGVPITGMTEYMFQDSIPLHVRVLSFFHFWLPFLLIWLLRRTGYHPSGLPVWIVLAFSSLYICYFFIPAPPAPISNPNLPVNINYVYGFSDQAAQTWMPETAWFVLLQLMLIFLLFLPTHWLLKRIYPAAKS